MTTISSVWVSIRGYYAARHARTVSKGTPGRAIAARTNCEQLFWPWRRAKGNPHAE